VFADTASGSLCTRPELEKCLDYLRAGDTLVVWKLDRLERGIAFRSLHDPIDTSTASGKLVFNLFAALAEFDRDLIRERAVAGTQAAIEPAAHPSRKPTLSDERLRQARARPRSPARCASDAPRSTATRRRREPRASRVDRGD
jgi:DNA invertase Pin-like site-specific DNA recombinase